MAKPQATTWNGDLGTSRKVMRAREGHADQALADADQTAALADQEMSGIDQGASDSDQSASALDERNSEYDQVNADRTFHEIQLPTADDVRRHDASRRARQAVSVARGENRQTRVRTSRDRDAAAGQRDRTGDDRDERGLDRDGR